uniref:Uncharacterized protein n=1 Tax=Anguilla anguilla TaxID=7936 RepID=A0A0E9UPQ6_ANGAN
MCCSCFGVSPQTIHSIFSLAIHARFFLNGVLVYCMFDKH